MLESITMQTVLIMMGLVFIDIFRLDSVMPALNEKCVLLLIE